MRVSLQIQHVTEDNRLTPQGRLVRVPKKRRANLGWKWEHRGMNKERRDSSSMSTSTRLGPHSIRRRSPR